MTDGTAIPSDRISLTMQLYDFMSYVVSAGRAYLTDGGINITTVPARWAYAVTIPANRAVAANCTVCLTLEIEVKKGALQIGALNSTETDFVGTVTEKEGARRRVQLVIPWSERIGPLVIRNASTHGESQGWCRLLQAGVLTSDDLDQFALNMHASAEALSHARERLSQFPEMIGTIREAVELLRAPLSRSGLTLLDAQPERICSAFSGLDVGVLLALADHLKVLLPLRPMPDWSFDEFLSRPDLATAVRHAVWKALHGLASPPPLALPWHGRTIFNTHFDNDLSLMTFVGGTYEPNEFALLDRLVRPGMNVVDGGANEGIYTLFLARKVGPNGRVVAVEPSPREASRLRVNLNANKLHNVVLIAAALAERAGTLSLKIAELNHAGQNTLDEFIYQNVTSTEAAMVPSLTLDGLLGSHLQHVEVIKLDIEGAELEALKGARNMLQSEKPLLLLETSPNALAHQDGSVDELRLLLQSFDYRMLCFDLTTGLPVPIANCSLSDNVVAVHRERDWGLPTT